MPEVRIKNDPILDAMKSVVVNRDLMDVISALIERDDDIAITTIRTHPTGHPVCLEAEAVLQHNERFRSWFRAAAKDDPFGKRSRFH